MPAPVVKIELGADLGARDADTFTLDDPVKGLLDNTLYTLGGTRFFDITDRLISANTQRGKSVALDRIDAGTSNIVLDNADRLFDPLFESGFYYGNLVPGREVKISCNGFPVIDTFIDDIDIAYEPGNRSVVSIQGVDGLSDLTINNLPEVSPSIELSGARVTRILDLPEVNWPAADRSIDEGTSLLSDTDITEGTQTISYLQLSIEARQGRCLATRLLCKSVAHRMPAKLHPRQWLGLGIIGRW